MTELVVPIARWNELRFVGPIPIGLTIIFASIASYLALHMASRLTGSQEPLWRRITSAVLMGGALPVVYYTGIAATNPGHAVHPLDPTTILLIVLVTLGLTLFLSTGDHRPLMHSADVGESERRYRELVESAQVVFWQRDPQLDRFTFVSQEAEALLGFACDHWLQSRNFWQDHIYGEDRELAAAHYRKALAAIPFEPFEHRLLASDGRIVWVRTSMRLVTRRGGGHELVGFMIDITKRKQVEEAFEEQRRLFEALMDASPESIYFKDVNSRFVRINKTQTERFGLSDPNQALGKTDFDFFTGIHAKKALWDEQEIIRTGEPMIDCEEMETWPEGHVTWVSTTKMPLRNSRDEICGTIGVSRNITERKLAQEHLQERTRELLKTNAELEQQIVERRLLEGQLVQAQKLESIGQLAAGVAHEINTPIQYVGDNCRFFADSFQQIDTILRQYSALLDNDKQTGAAPDLVRGIEKTVQDLDLAYLMEEIPHAIDQCNEGVERVAHIVRAMKEFSHPGSARMEGVDLNHSIQSTLTVCRNEWKYVAEANTDLDPGLPPVRCLVGEINQVFLNIVVNAAHAIADAKKESGGKIRVTTRLHGDVVEVRIADNGTGIPESVQSRIFDPFFTTKEVGRGSGQGLAIARNVVVKKHGGTLTFETVNGEGTEFIIRLPVAGLPTEESPEPINAFRDNEAMLGCSL